MTELEKKCKECGKKEVSEVKIRPICDSNNWICRNCQTKINKQIIKEKEEEERKKEEEYKLRQEEERKEKEKWETLLNSESVIKLEDMFEKHCYRFPGKCSTWKCSSGDKIIVFTKSDEIKPLDRWGCEQKPTLYCAKCYLNHDFNGRQKKEKLIKKSVIDDGVNTNCDNCNKKIPGRNWHLWRGYYQNEANKTGILCYYCKGEEIDKLATYDKEEKPAITEKEEKKQSSIQQSVVIQNSLPKISQNKNDKLIEDLNKKVNDLQIKIDDKDKIIQVQADRIKELERKLINKKIKFKEDKLEDLIQELEVERPKVIQLRNACEQLAKAKNNCNLFEVKRTEEEIEEIKNKLSAEKKEGMRKIFHKCEKLAKLRFKREQAYEAKIELLSS
jgi:hypothetical protein